MLRTLNPVWAALVLLVLSGCMTATTPPAPRDPTAENRSRTETTDRPDTPPPPQRIKAPRSDFDLGLRITLQAYFEVGFVEDDSLTELVNDVGYRVASVVPEPALFTFHVIDLPYPNAFALPGGFIFVTKGMLEMDLTEPELATLLGHEIGHVVGGHFSRSQRLSSILSLAELALLVGVLLVGDQAGASNVQYEQQGDMVYRGSSGYDALVQGVPTFGGLFRTLIERKYGRGLEFEADEYGVELATRAGYPADAAEQMLIRFKSRIHEDATYGYWLTHPFFRERVNRAAAMGRANEASPDPPPAFAYRRAVQRELFRLATQREDEMEGAFLFNLALQAEPHGMRALEAGREILLFRTDRNMKKRPLERNLWPIIADYDSLLVRARRMAPDGDVLQRMEQERDSLDAVRLRALPEFIERLDRSVRSTRVLEGFVRNYPESERLPEARDLLARHYFRSGRYPVSTRTALELIDSDPDPPWRGRGEATLAELIPVIESPIVLQPILGADLPDSLHQAAVARMDSLVVEVASMEEAAAFLDRFPESDYAPRMSEQLESQASEAYRQAKILEGVAQEQQALDAYHRILFLAPDSGAATEARDRIDYLVRVS